MKLLFSYISRALNRYLHLDPESRQRLARLEGKVVTIELLPLHLTFQLHFNAEGVTLSETSAETPDTLIRGTPLQMMSMMIAKDRQRFFADDVLIEGSAELGQQVIELFDAMQIDWEEYLAKIAGDMPAHHTGKLVRNVRSWLKQVSDNLHQNINEYLHEEKPWFPSREALNDFFDDIDQLRMDIDRLDVKVQLLLKDKKDHS